MISDVFNSMVNSLEDILSIQQLPNFGTLPPEATILSKSRAGSSTSRALGKVLQQKKRLNIPTGNLDDGSLNHDEILWLTAIEAIMDEIVYESKITATVLPGQQLVASGGNAGGPIVVYGATTTFGDGAALIE